MKAAHAALEADQEATDKLEKQVVKLSQDDKVLKHVLKDLAKSGGSVSIGSVSLSSLLTASSGGVFKKGLEATAQIFGDDVAKEMSKMIAVTSGKIVSGSFTVVLGGVTMAYDIYKLTNQVEEMAKLGQDGASEIRTVAKQLEVALDELRKDDSVADDLEFLSLAFEKVDIAACEESQNSANSVQVS